MRRRVPYDAERSRLLDDLRAAFEPGAFSEAYPGVEPPMSVSIGGDAEDLAFEVAVWPLPQSVTNEHLSTCPLITTEFDLVVGLVTSGATDRDATEALLAYVDCVHQCCMADPDLGGLVSHLDPRLDRGGVGPDGTYGFVAGANVNVSCRRDVRPNRRVERAVRSVG